MDRQILKNRRRTRRRAGIRKRIIGTPSRPRLCVYRSLNHVYVQIIDDLQGHTILSASSRDPDLRLSNGGNISAAEAVGAKIAERAKAAGINAVVFDRGGFLYHGRVRAVAEAVRKGGLEF